MRILPILIKNGIVITHKEIFNANIFIKNGKIHNITKDEVKADIIINAEDKIVMPGVIDAHVHFRQPGGKSEDWESGSKAAVAGGVTTVIDMPNNIPPTITINNLIKKKEIIEKSNTLVNYGLHFGVTEDNLEEVKKVIGRDLKRPLVASAKIFMAKSTGNLLVRNLNVIENVVRSSKLVTVHAEDEEIIEKFPSRPKLAAISAISKLLPFANLGKICILHITSIEEAKLASPFYKEVTPHHLFLNSSILSKLGNYAKVNPPLRDEKDRLSLWEALNNNLIDYIASDHAPHLKEDKEKEDAPSGVPGVETMLPLMMNAALNKLISLQKLVELMCYNPSRIFGLKNKGVIEVGADADIVIVDRKLERKVSADELHYKCKWTPYEGMYLKGWPVITIVNGKIAYKDGEFFQIKGNEVIYE
jgi:dihydroorotase